MGLLCKILVVIVSNLIDEAHGSKFKDTFGRKFVFP